MAAKSKASKVFAAHVRELIEDPDPNSKTRMSVPKLAQLAHVNTSQVYRVLSGEISCSLDTAQRFADALQVPLAELLAEPVHSGA